MDIRRLLNKYSIILDCSIKNIYIYTYIKKLKFDMTMLGGVNMDLLFSNKISRIWNLGFLVSVLINLDIHIKTCLSATSVELN